MNRATPLFLTTHHTARPRAWDPGHARRGLPRGAAQWACPTEPPPPPTYLSPGLAAVRHTYFCPHSEGHLVSTAGGLNPQSKLAGEQVATSQTKPEHSGPGPHCTAQGHPRAPTHGTTGHWPPDNWPGTRSHEQRRLWTGQEWTWGRPRVSPDGAPGGPRPARPAAWWTCLLPVLSCHSVFKESQAPAVPLPRRGPLRQTTPTRTSCPHHCP